MTGALTVAALHLPAARDAAQPDLARARAPVEAAAAAGARLVALPELFAWPFFPPENPARWRHVREPLRGRTTAWASALADELGIALLVPLALATEGGGALNAVTLVRPGTAPVRAGAKVHLPPPGAGDLFGEADHFQPGPAEIRCFDLAGFRIAVLVCFDRRFPESWRTARAAGADLVICPVAGPADEPDGFFAAELRTHARENGVYALSAGLCGEAAGGAAAGGGGRSPRHNAPTLLAGPDGSLLDERGADAGPGMVIGSIRRDALGAARARNPFFERRRALAGVVLS